MPARSDDTDPRAAVSAPATRAPSPVLLLVAAALGTLHAAASLSWGLGGQWLVETLGTDLRQRFAGWTWVLVPVGLLKLAAAWAPSRLAAHGWPLWRTTRALCWLGAVALTVWGGLNTVVGNLVLAGAIRPDGGYDRPGMIGHAWLWDPLFLAWGLTLAAALWTTRRRFLPTRRGHLDGRSPPAAPNVVSQREPSRQAGVTAPAPTFPPPSTRASTRAARGTPPARRTR